MGFLQIQPRVCGDYEIEADEQDPYIDTTPRVRGLRALVLFEGLDTRYNPACAGTTDDF